MKKPTRINLQVNENGQLNLPPEILSGSGFKPGDEVRVELNDQGIKVSPSVHRLTKVYIEPTNLCNLACSTCMRSVWDDPLGSMSLSTFYRILEGILAFNSRPAVFFGGYGEPLAHPEIETMVNAARSAGLAVEMITNGTLLDKSTAQWMVQTGLQRLWVSIDGASPESYADIRLGAELPSVLANLSILQNVREESGSPAPRLGIAFVAMKQNIADLSEIVRIGKNLGADLFSVSGLLPHLSELRSQILYRNSLEDSRLQPSDWAPTILLPRLDLTDAVLHTLAECLQQQVTVHLGQEPLQLGANQCPFVEKGSVSIRFDGAVSPCLPLLHTHISLLGENVRRSHAHAIGNVQDRSLLALWNDPAYVKLRMRLDDFDFSPCAFCNSCQMAESNEMDCFGSDQPACGGCLWAQGFIQCP